MPDDRDADVGPASDREDLFGRAPASEPSAADTSATRDDTPADPDSSDRGAADRVQPDAGRGSKKSRGPASSFFRELPVLLLVAFLLAFLLRTFVVQVFFIPSGSMEPTLQVDDRMVVEKISYLFREPARGEIVVFEGETFGTVDPDASAGERIVRGLGQFLGVVPASARDYVKRVIGLPGDEIVIQDGEVRVNGHLLDEPYVVYEDSSDYGPVTVPEGHLFFLGDNRPNSSDSRRGLGFVPTEAVIGRSAVIIWPLENAGLLTGVEHDDVPEVSEVSDDPATDVEDAAA